MLSGCYAKATQSQRSAMVLKQATGPTAMWYRFSFKAQYQGDPVKFDQYVFCAAARTPYGSAHGNNANPVTIRPQPETAAKTMSDGSQLLIRIPNMCEKYRMAKNNDNRTNKDIAKGPYGRPGWLSRGPFQTIPLVIWSDKTPIDDRLETQPERVEAYFGRAYYNDPKARIKELDSSIELMPIGYFPPNYEAVLTQKRAYPTLRYFTTNIYNKKQESHDYMRGIHPEFRAYYISPISDLNAYAEKYKDVGKFREVKVGDQKWEKKWVSSAPDKPEEESSFGHAEVSIFNSSQYDSGDIGEDESSHLMPNWQSKCIKKLKSGHPLYTNIPNKPGDNGFLAEEFYRKGSDSYSRSIKGRAESYRKQVICFENLNRLQSFDIVDGRLDTSPNIPGMIVYHRWQRPFPSGQSYNGIPYSPDFKPVVLFENNVFTEEQNDFLNGKTKFAVNGIDFEFDTKRSFKRFILRTKNENKWFYVQPEDSLLKLSDYEEVTDMFYTRRQK